MKSNLDMKMKPLLKKTLVACALALSVLVSLVLPQTARAELVVNIDSGQMQPLPIAITDLVGGTPEEVQRGRDLAGVISADLERSGLFRPIDPKAFIQSAQAANEQVRFPDWKAINAQALVTGKAILLPTGELRIEFRLWDVFGESYLTGMAFTYTPKDWRRLAHKAADVIYERLTGEKGYFDTQIVYVAESGPRDRRVKRLAIMDQDGENHKFLTDPAENLVLTPRFSPTSREITYMSFYRNVPRVYVYNLDTGRRELLGDFPAMTFAPRFSPDGNRVIMSLSNGRGSSSIYEMDLRTRRANHLTSDGGVIDTSPSFAPDGSQIAFESDRGGSQQIYVMGADGSGIHRISFGDGNYATPVWSPRGDLIAFTKMKGAEFFIGVMRVDGSGERLLSHGYLVEGPTWAPNGRVLAYFRQSPTDAGGHGGSTKIYTIDLTGYNERQLVTPLEASDPAWSPLIP